MGVAACHAFDDDDADFGDLRRRLSVLLLTSLAAARRLSSPWLPGTFGVKRRCADPFDVRGHGCRRLRPGVHDDIAVVQWFGLDGEGEQPV